MTCTLRSALSNIKPKWTNRQKPNKRTKKTSHQTEYPERKQINMEYGPHKKYSGKKDPFGFQIYLHKMFGLVPDLPQWCCILISVLYHLSLTWPVLSPSRVWLASKQESKSPTQTVIFTFRTDLSFSSNVTTFSWWPAVDTVTLCKRCLFTKHLILYQHWLLALGPIWRKICYICKNFTKVV